MQLITRGQAISLQDLSSSSRVFLLSADDHSALINHAKCPTWTKHFPVVYMPTEFHPDVSEDIFNRLSTDDCVLTDIKKENMQVFISGLKSLLHKEDFKFSILEGNVQCKNTFNKYNNCTLNLTYHRIEFYWSS